MTNFFLTAVLNMYAKNESTSFRKYKSTMSSREHSTRTKNKTENERDDKRWFRNELKSNNRRVLKCVLKEFGNSFDTITIIIVSS